jgi:hypothetical protein
MMSITYTRLRSGNWGIRANNIELKVGDKVKVSTKAGEVHEEKISKILWTGQDGNNDPVLLAEIAKRPKDKASVAQAGGLQDELEEGEKLDFV